MPRRVAITGAAGQLGRQLALAFTTAGDEVLQLLRPDFDITNSTDLARMASWRPDVVINSAAWTDVDGCAGDPERAMRINGEAAGAVAATAARAGALVAQISTNEVFGGELERPYTEDDPTDPVNAYGASKLEGERLVAAANPRHLIVRTAWLFGGGARDFPTKIRRAADQAAADGLPLRVVADEWGNPTDVRALGPALARLVAAAVVGSLPLGAWHLAGWPPVTRHEWARQVLGESVELVPVSSADYPRRSRVPLRAVLDVRRAERAGVAPGSAPSESVVGSP